MEPDDEIYANGEADSSNSRNRPIISSEQLDIEAYAGLYTGRTKITRLLFIADQCGQNNNTAMQMEALRMAYEEIKKGENTQLFRDVVHKIDGRLGDDYGMDSAWCEMVDRRADQRKEKLENELNAYRTNLIKESIRMGYNDFGDYYYAHGSLAEAFKSYVRTRDYCTTSKHVIHMCMSAILVSIEMGQFTHVTSYINKAEQTADALDPNTVSKLRCAAGLANLDAKKYKLAARKFLEVGPELGNSYNEVIAPQDVATYGGLCALASFDRMELKNKVIDSINFRNFLELVPEVRELIHDFYSSHYASCLDYLGNLKANLMLDIHLHDHVQTLYDQIRNKALIQYTHPFLHELTHTTKFYMHGMQIKGMPLSSGYCRQARHARCVRTLCIANFFIIRCKLLRLLDLTVDCPVFLNLNYTQVSFLFSSNFPSTFVCEVRHFHLFVRLFEAVQLQLLGLVRTVS
ncbi:COP9 signalosome complex subunit 1 isoform X2 [Populus alba x Populus x berolinensis]|uniref:COP9 signalosome complex subunit 1 isoform X2 n=1 Tax=Populus alba x Populus x berolinensis TaxID=444605 RepID=A0AAD6RFS2_9ROSI|nr:COP9 signalosome complex subunit 1 isoform X2 [Populus alba x Populus x berolinensis]